MAIRSTFYDTTPGEGVKETSWAQSAQSRGPLYGVVGAGDLALTPHATTPYAVNLSAGKFWGHGVWDESTGVSLVQSVAPPKDVVRWDLIAAHRDWQPTGGGPTSFVSIQGGTAAGIPTSREKRPGIVDDQPLYLLKWKGGQTQPEQIIDLRCWASNGGVEVVDKLAMGYLETPGAEVKLGNELWRCEPKGNGVWGWGVHPYRTDGVAYTPTWSGFEYRGDTHISKGMYWVNGDRVTVKAMIQSGRNPSLGLATVGFSLPPGLPVGADFLASGSGVMSTFGTSGQMRQVVTLAGPGQSGATVWVDRNPFVTPGSAGFSWGEGHSFHVQIDYRL